MKLSCKLVPRDDKIRQQLIGRLLALGFEPFSDGEAIAIEYEGVCDGTPLAAITVFESFGCDHAIVFKDWGKDCGEGQDEESKTCIKVTLCNGTKPCGKGCSSSTVA